MRQRTTLCNTGRRSVPLILHPRYKAVRCNSDLASSAAGTLPIVTMPELGRTDGHQPTRLGGRARSSKKSSCLSYKAGDARPVGASRHHVPLISVVGLRDYLAALRALHDDSAVWKPTLKKQRFAVEGNFKLRYCGSWDLPYGTIGLLAFTAR